MQYTIPVLQCVKHALHCDFGSTSIISHSSVFPAAIKEVLYLQHQHQPSSSKFLQCVQTLVAAQPRLDVHVSSRLFCPHLAQQPPALDWRIAFAWSSCLRGDPRRINLHPCGDPGLALLRVRLSDHHATIAAQRRSELRHHLLRDVDASAVLFASGFRHCRSSLHFWVHHWNASGRRCGVGINFHAPVLQAPRISEYSQQHVTVPAFFFVSLPDATARHHCCSAAHDVFSRPRVETEPATVQPVHSEFLLWSRGLVWLEQDLFTECCNLLIEWFAFDALVSRHNITTNVVNVHVACRTSHLKTKLSRPTVAPICRSV